MKYKLVKNANPDWLEEEVNELIKQGWTPLGGVSVACYEGEDYFAQALTKPEEHDG